MFKNQKLLLGQTIFLFFFAKKSPQTLNPGSYHYEALRAVNGVKTVPSVCLSMCVKLLPRASSFKSPKGFRGDSNPELQYVQKPRVAPASRNYCLSYGPRNFIIKLYIVTTLRVLCRKHKRPHRQPLTPTSKAPPHARGPITENCRCLCV